MNHRREEAQMITVKTYRGHIRNWKELCAELEVDPALPRAEKEQEILTKAYQKWGGEMADHIYGMFAFALWDEEEKKLFCLRDQFGTKPFYYYQTEDGELLYGTMIRDIIGQPGFKKELNEEMLQIYMSLTYVAGEDTFFKGLKKLMPGRYLIWKDGKVEIHRYWTPKFQPDESKSLEDWADEIHSTLKSIMPEVKTEDETVESFLWILPMCWQCRMQRSPIPAVMTKNVLTSHALPKRQQNFSEENIRSARSHHSSILISYRMLCTTWSSLLAMPPRSYLPLPAMRPQNTQRSAIPEKVRMNSSAATICTAMQNVTAKI